MDCNNMCSVIFRKKKEEKKNELPARAKGTKQAL
jgi:hypothetical protein